MKGAVFVDKPGGITSFDVCRQIKRIYNVKKCGHAGTLDPLATGVLPVLVGGATRFLNYIPQTSKTYEASFKTGFSTDTLDITGRVIKKYNKAVSDSQIIEASSVFIGDIEQLPPMYSAVSVNGKRLYEYARQGITVERKKRQVHIFSFNITKSENGLYNAVIKCSKGTYIRTLIYDLGEHLGCGATLTKLRRTYTNGIDILKCTPLNLLSDNLPLIPIENYLSSYPGFNISAAQSIRFKNGGSLFLNRINYNLFENDKIYRVFSPEAEFLGLGKVRNNELIAEKLMV